MRSFGDFACGANFPRLASGALPTRRSVFPSSFRSFVATRLWLLALLATGAFLVGVNLQRMQRVDAVSRTDAADALLDPASPTGYAGAKRWLIVPEHNNRSYQWIMETQQMLAESEWRLRHIDYENAPSGHEVRSASIYRWWLALLAWTHHQSTHVPLAASVERVALWSDPLLHFALLIGTTFYIARRFGAHTATIAALALTFLFPFAASFLPGVPNDRSLSLVAAVWTILPLLAKRGAGEQNRFLIAGIAGGFGLWVDPTSELPVLIGVVAGAIFSGLLTRRVAPAVRGDAPGALPWRLWALGGAATGLLGYLVEYSPNHFSFDLRLNHPLFAIAWIGFGEFLHQFEVWRFGPKRTWNPRTILPAAAAVLAIAALPAAMHWIDARPFLGGDLYSSRLSFLPNGVVADNVRTWFTRDRLSAALIATLLPLLLLAPGIWIVIRKPDSEERRRLALALGPVAISLGLSCAQLSWWAVCGATLIGLLVATSAAIHLPRARWAWAGAIALALLPGGVRLRPAPGSGDIAFTRFEILGLMERGLAHWLSDHAGAERVVLLAPPDQTTSLCFHANFPGIGTANPENQAGLEATVRIATATTAEIARTLIDERGVTHLVLPSWDRDLEAFAAWRLPNPEDAFVMALRHWALPSWLEPIAYPLPVVAGFEDQSVMVLKVTENTNRVLALSRLAEYFLETRQPDLAEKLREPLQRYPAHPAALLALAALEESAGNGPAFTRAVAEIAAGLENGVDRALPWDRRVSLAIMLALGQQQELAREQVRLCLEKADASKIRSLSVGSLYRLQVLAKAFNVEMTDPKLRELARRLLPAELRARL